MKSRKSGKVNMKTVRRLFSYITAYKFRFIAVVLGILLSAVGNVGASLFLKTLIDRYITPMLKGTMTGFSHLFKAGAFMGCIYLMAVLGSFIANRTMVSISQGILKDIRKSLFSHMETLPLKYFDTHTHGDLMSRFTNDTDTLRQLFSQSIPQIFSCLVTIVFVFISMLVLSPVLTAFLLVSVFLILRVTKYIAGKSAGYFRQQQNALGEVNGYIEEMVAGQKSVKLFGYEEKTKENFSRKNEELCKNATRANSCANILMPIMGNLGNLQYVLLAIFGSILAFHSVGTITLGTIASFLQLSRSFMDPVNQISNQLNNFVMALAGAERIFCVLDSQSEKDEGDVCLVERNGVRFWSMKEDGESVYRKVRGEIEFKNVSFSYDDEKDVLKNVSFRVKPSEKVALVGHTGAGKTTVTNLLHRFYDITEGEILYDGIDIRRIKKADLRKSLGNVLQDTHLFSGSILYNIRYGNLDADEKMLRDAARLANAEDFILSMEDGYDSMIAENADGLSVGERQLLAIARAAVNNPSVMILDEATSSIDTRTERIVQDGMDRLMQKRTVLVIAHRLSTIQNADCILVFDGGEIIERGTHEQLMRLHGKYYELYNADNTFR